MSPSCWHCCSCSDHRVMKRQRKTLDCIIKKAGFVTYLSSWKDANVGLPQVQVVRWNIKELPFNLLYVSLSIRSLPFISRCFFFLLSVKFQVIPVVPVFSWHNDHWKPCLFWLWTHKHVSWVLYFIFGENPAWWADRNFWVWSFLNKKKSFLFNWYVLKMAFPEYHNT